MRMRRVEPSVLVSIGLHVVVGALIVQLLTFGSPLGDLFRRERATSLPVERISFLALPRSAGPTTPGRSGGDGRPERAPERLPPLVAPLTVPTLIPEPAPATPSFPEQGSGPLVGTGGPTRGVRPSFSEPRIWVPPAEVVSAPKTVSERLDSVLTALIQQKEDSLRLTASARRPPGDWTWERGGKKYGWNQKGIQLGDATIPSALLPALAANVALNPAAMERQTLDRLNREVREQSTRGLNEEEFRNRVRSIRERKERERAKERAAQAEPEGR